MGNWTIITGSIAFFTLILDLVDFAPQIKSFRFVLSLTYFIYYILHFTLGLLTAIILEATGKIPNPFLLAFVAVLSSITVLENFAMKFGGQTIVDLPSVFENYRARMIEEESERAMRAQQAEIMKLTSKLIVLKPEKLESELMTMLVSVSREAANERIAELKEAAGGDEKFLRRLFASEMVQLNREYVLSQMDEWLKSSQLEEAGNT